MVSEKVRFVFRNTIFYISSVSCRHLFFPGTAFSVYSAHFWEIRVLFSSSVNFSHIRNKISSSCFCCSFVSLFSDFITTSSPVSKTVTIFLPERPLSFLLQDFVLPLSSTLCPGLSPPGLYYVFPASSHSANFRLDSMLY